MENKHLTEAQSLELITSMINDTRNRLARNSGTPFLIWGYTTVAVSVLNYILIRSHYQNFAGWSWLLTPLIGWIGMLIYTKKDKGATNYIDRVISIIWTVIGISFLWVMFASIFYHTPILFFTILMAGIGTTMTGFIISDKTTKICGIVAMIASLSFPISRWIMTHFIELNDNVARMEWINAETLLFAAIFFFMMVIPGHILNRKYNK